jgi:hypothetical protein
MNSNATLGKIVHHRTRAVRFGVSISITLALLSGCNWGDDDNTPEPPPPAPPAQFALGVSVSGSGSVGSQPAGISCGASCSASYAANTAVTLTATPAAGQVFTAWGGDCTGAGSTCSVTMSAARTVTAAFNAPPATSFGLAVTVTGSGVLRSQPAGIDCGSTCSANFASGTSVTLTPTPAAGQSFSAWGGACTGAGTTCTVSMSQERTATAAFVATAPIRFDLAVAITGSGAVRSSPAGIDCGTTCSAGFADGASVTLTATPGAGQVFSAWSGACSGSAATCNLSMTQVRSAAAAFVAAPVAPAWQTAQLMEFSNDFNVAGTSTAAGVDALSAIASNGDAIVMWEQSDGQPNGSTRKVFSRRYVAGVGWDAAVTVPGLTTSSSSVALVQGKLLMDSAGTATWVRPNIETRRFTAAAGWGSPFLPPAISGGTLTSAAMDAGGNISVLISGSNVSNNTLAVGGSWGSWTRVDTSGNLVANRAEVALSANGSAMAVWRESNPGDSNYSLKAARFTGATGWQAPQSIETGFDNVIADSPPRVAMDASGNAIAVWHQGNSVYFNVFSAATSAWATATQVDAGQVSSSFGARINLAMTPDGRAVAAWNSGLFAMKAMRYTPGSGFSVPVSVAPYSIERTLGIDDSGNAVVVYSSFAQWPNPSGPLNVYSRRWAWGDAWSEAAVIETGAGGLKDNIAVAFNRAGQGVAAWAQNDVAGSDVRNSLWANLLR